MTGTAPILLVGCPRSGTTLLRVMLNAHSRIGIPPENRFVSQLWFGRHRFRPAGSPRAARRMARAITVRGRGSVHLGTDRERLVADFQAVRPATPAEALDRVFSSWAAQHGKARWGDKRPAYYALFDPLAALFPEARFIHLVRDGRACTASLQRPPFDYSPERAAATWLNSMYAGQRALRRLGPDRLVEIRYEDLTADPEATLRRLCDFLGETFEPAMLRPEDVVADYVPAGFQQHGQIAAGVHTGSVRAWERELADHEIAALERLGARHLRRHGYDLSGRGRAVSVHTARVAARHLVFRLVLPTSWWLDRLTDAPGRPGRVARRLWRRLRPRRLLFR